MNSEKNFYLPAHLSKRFVKQLEEDSNVSDSLLLGNNGITYAMIIKSVAENPRTARL